MRHAIRLLLAAAVWLLALSQPAVGFDEQVTHPALTEESTRRSSLDANLKSEIGLNAGIDTLLRGQGSDRQEVLRWLRDGSRIEDDPACRAGHHFHNPLKPFSTSGVTNQAFVVRLGCSGSGFLPPRSSVTWGTGFISPTARGPATGNPFDWDAARVAFLNGLTTETPEAREAELARSFEALGHLLHLVQDLAVPAHVRNDFPAHEAFFPRTSLNIVQWFQEPFERFVRTNRGLVAEAAAQAEQVDFIGQLVTRFWDTDRYTGANPTADLLQGLAEYTNANFASPNTIFTEDLDPSNEFAFPYPRRSSTNFDLVTSKDDRLVQFVTAEDGREDRVLYLAKTGDGELIDRFLRLGFFTGDVLDKAPPGTPAKLLVQIDDDVHRAYGAKLLPRAIGYGAGLLDYFFRGKLEFELVAGADPSQATLVGFNRSGDALGAAGKLTLYWEDAAGQRLPVESPAVTLGSPIEKNGPLPELTFTWPSDPERPPKRFVLAYQGPFGLEAGATIGKVVENPALEQAYQTALFDENTQQYVFPWFLRTAEGIYVLPFEDSLPGQFVNDLRWGEKDNMLVVQANQGDDVFAGTTFVVFEIDRAEGVRAVPTTPEIRHGHPVVALHQVRAVPLTALAGLDLGTTVDLSHRHILRQFLLSFTVTTASRWDDAVPGYVFDGGRVSDGSLRLATTFDATYAQTFRLVTDAAHFGENCFDLPCPHYEWFWEDFALTAAGEVLLLVLLREGGLPEAQQGVPAWGHLGSGDVIGPVGNDFGLAFSFPDDSPFLNDSQKHRFVAWVNLSQRAVAAKTMSDRVTLGQVTVQDTLREEQQDITEKSGGPDAGTTKFDWFRIFSSPCMDPANVEATAEIQLEEGLVSLAYTGLYRGEFAPLGLETDFVLGPAATVTKRCGAPKPYQLTRTAHQLAAFPYLITNFGFLTQSVLPGTQALERFPLVFTRRSGEGSQLVLWDGLKETAQRLFQVAAPDAFEAPTANQRWALVEGYPTVHLVALDGSGTLDLPWEDEFGRRFLDMFTLVAPDRLYNALDDTFYTVVGQALKPTKFRPDPLRAAAFANVPFWPFHLVRPR